MQNLFHKDFQYPHTLLECYQLVEGLNNLGPDYPQQLLEASSSIKVKRLFLHLAEKANHSWYQYLDREKMNPGKTVVTGHKDIFHWFGR